MIWRVGLLVGLGLWKANNALILTGTAQVCSYDHILLAGFSIIYKVAIIKDWLNHFQRLDQYEDIAEIDWYHFCE